MTIEPVQTPGIKFVAGIPIFSPNSVYSGDGFYISHDDTDRRIYGSETTALVQTKGLTAFYILNGDHRQQYARLIPNGYAACKEYFDSLPELHNSMSDTEESLAQLQQMLSRNTHDQ